MEDKGMKKALRYLVLVCFMALPIFTAKAQIYFMDVEEQSLSNRDVTPVGEIPIPPIDMDNDWIPGQEPDYTPLGDGVMALGLLAGAYLLTKRRKHE